MLCCNVLLGMKGSVRLRASQNIAALVWVSLDKLELLQV